MDSPGEEIPAWQRYDEERIVFLDTLKTRAALTAAWRARRFHEKEHQFFGLLAMHATAYLATQDVVPVIGFESLRTVSRRKIRLFFEQKILRRIFTKEGTVTDGLSMLAEFTLWLTAKHGEYYHHGLAWEAVKLTVQVYRTGSPVDLVRRTHQKERA